MRFGADRSMSLGGTVQIQHAAALLPSSTCDRMRLCSGRAVFAPAGRLVSVAVAMLYGCDGAVMVPVGS